MSHKLALFAIVVAGCSPPVSGEGVIVGDVLLGAPMRPDRPLQQALGPNGHHIIFVNFDGVTLAADYDDSIHDRSSIAASVGHSVTVPAFVATDLSNQFTRAQIIDDVMNQARKFYADFNVDLVTTRPQSGDYVMTAVGGDPSLIGDPCSQNGCVAGIAPLDCQIGGNQIIYNAQGDIEVVYAFSATAKQFGGSYQGKVLDLATTIAQETAHAYGLGHTDNAQDVMNPYETGQTIGFLSGSYADSNNCAHGVGTQDSHGLLLQILGPTMGPQDVTPPTVKLTAPANGSTLPRTFMVSATATDDTGVDHVDIQATGPGPAFMQRVDAAPYNATVVVTTDGTWAVSATAYDAVGNMASATATVTVKNDAKLPLGSTCTSAAQCQSGVCANTAGGEICTSSCASTPCPMGYSCNAQKLCEMAAAPGSVGSTCATDADCTGKLCAELGGKHFCTAACTVGDLKGCPSGMVCVNYGADGTLCSFPSGGGGSSCSVAAARAPGGSGAALLLLLALAPLVRRLRRRA